MERERAKSEGVSNRNPHSLLMMLKNGTARRTMVQLAISNKSKHTLNIALLGIYSNELKTYVNPKKKKAIHRWLLLLLSPFSHVRLCATP